MNEQLIVKNFGPIKDATVDFKRVTVFIGPTGGGKSTLAKLVSIIKNNGVMVGQPDENGAYAQLVKYGISNYYDNESEAIWKRPNKLDIIITTKGNAEEHEANQVLNDSHFDNLVDAFMHKHKAELKKLASKAPRGKKSEWELNLKKQIREHFIDSSKRRAIDTSATYIPSERIFVPAIEYSWAGLMRDDIGLPKILLDFANAFSLARKAILELDIIFLNAKYLHIDGRDLIKVVGRDEFLLLLETASGIQSVTPMLVLLEHLSRNTEQAQSFIIEEPELNLYPTAQQGLLNWLVEKCTKVDNDLTLTTHSPYLLAHLNTLLFAHQVAHNHPERAEEIAKIVPRESWLNPAEFAAYHVEGQQENGVRSIVNPETGLISYNGLDAIASAESGEFEKLLDINAGLAIEW